MGNVCEHLGGVFFLLWGHRRGGVGGFMVCYFWFGMIPGFDSIDHGAMKIVQAMEAWKLSSDGWDINRREYTTRDTMFSGASTSKDASAIPKSGGLELPTRHG